MKLERKDANLFYELMWPLQFFAKERLQMFPEITSLEEYQVSDAQIKLEVRDRLFDQRTLIDTFVAENPQQLPDEHLQIIQSWTNAVYGDFYLERMLKRHTIFIATNDNVYAVWGLMDDFDEMIHKSHLPMLLKTLLLPFQGKIIYDGLFQAYNMHFGGGIRGSLKEIYLAAKQNGRIIETLENGAGSDGKQTSTKPQKDWTPQLKKLATGANKLRSGAGQPAIHSPTFKLIKASIELGQQAAADPDDVDQLWKAFKKVERSVRGLETTLYRMD